MGDAMCRLSDTELCDAVVALVSRMCDTGARGWRMSVPVDTERDSDILVSELVKRFRAAKAEDVRTNTVQQAKPATDSTQQA